MISLFFILLLATLSHTLASTSDNILQVLIESKGKHNFKEILDRLIKVHGDRSMFHALTDQLRKKDLELSVTCLKAAADPYPNNRMHVSEFFHDTWECISRHADDAEEFANIISSFNLNHTKLLVVIRYMITDRVDVVKVLEGVMRKSPLITDDLSSWLTIHEFDRICTPYSTDYLKNAFYYLASFATENTLEKALVILKKDEHYKGIDENGITGTECCIQTGKFFRDDLYRRIEGILKIVKARNDSIKEYLKAILPTALINLILDYIPVDLNHPSSVTTNKSEPMQID